MELGRPFMLLMLALIIPLSVAWVRLFRKRRTDLIRLAGEWRQQRLLDVYLFKNFFCYLFFLLFFVCSVFALAELGWGRIIREDKRKGRDIVFLLDISHSMLAADYAPSRLEHGLKVIRLMLPSLEGDRLGLVVFKGAAQKVLPLTEDVYAINRVLSHVNPAMVFEPGSNLESGLREAIATFAVSTLRHRSILLITDGEYRSGNPFPVAAEAALRETPIYVYAVGTEQGAEITLPGGKILMDENGAVVVSKLMMPVLERIARSSGGEILKLDNPAQAARQILSALPGFYGEESGTGFRQQVKSRYRLLLFWGILFLSLSLIIRAVRWRKTL